MLLDLMDLPKIMEDEDIVGWLGSIASANGWDSRSFMSAFFPENIYTFRGTLSVVRDYIGIYKKYGRFGFPDPGTMLMLHSAVPVSGLFMDDFYVGTLADMTLNGTDMLPFESKRLYRTFMYCPLCAKEDLGREGRVVVHIPHQVPGVIACYIHGVKLFEDPYAEPEKAREQDIRTAQAVHALYRGQAIGAFEDISDLLRRRAKERGISHEIRRDTFPVHATAVSLAASLFTDEELLQLYKKDANWFNACRIAVQKDSPGAKEFSRRHPLLTYTCDKCGTRVTQYALTALTGGMCPVCASHTRWQERTARRARHCIDPDFRIVRFHGNNKIDVRHVPCGRVIEDHSIMYVFRNRKVTCPFCKNDSYQGHIGETRTMNCGLKAVITKFDSKQDIDLKFEDGSEVKGIKYSRFLKGSVIPNRFYQNSHINEKNVMNCGVEGVVIRYASFSDIDVLFPDGSVACGVTYKAFKLGQLIPESLKPDDGHISPWKTRHKERQGKTRHKERQGETRRMNCGLMATIIDYKGAEDMVVCFETGEKRANVRYSNFLRGVIAPEGFYSPKVNEERVMKNGLKAKVIAVHSYLDVDVQFENGEIRKGIPHASFLKGYVRSEIGMACRRHHLEWKAMWM